MSYSPNSTRGPSGATIRSFKHFFEQMCFTPDTRKAISVRVQAPPGVGAGVDVNYRTAPSPSGSIRALSSLIFSKRYATSSAPGWKPCMVRSPRLVRCQRFSHHPVRARLRESGERSRRRVDPVLCEWRAPPRLSRRGGPTAQVRRSTGPALPVACQEVRERCFVTSSGKVRVAGVLTRGFGVGLSIGGGECEQFVAQRLEPNPVARTPDLRR